MSAGATLDLILCTYLNCHGYSTIQYNLIDHLEIHLLNQQIMGHKNQNIKKMEDAETSIELRKTAVG